MKRIVGTVAVLIGLGTPAWAGIETGLAAYLRGDFETAAREYRQLAENDDPAAQFGLGLLYHFGEGVPQDYAEAAQWYRKAAMQGEARAQYYFADLYRRGLGVEQHYTWAVWWYSAAADQGYAPAQYALGLMYRAGLGLVRDDVEAARLFREAALQDHVRAKAFLAHMYYIGHGVQQNPAEAARWYRGAAERGDTRSQKRLAEMLYHGDGIRRNRVKAASWYRRMAQQGDVDASFRLGVMYFNGEGLKRDNVKSHMWFDIAASRDQSGDNRGEAAKNRDIVARRMTPAQIVEARILADEWLDKQYVAQAVPLKPTRERVARIQKGLASIGFGHGKADGIYGPRTRAAIRAFQSAQGLKSTGKVSTRLETALQSATPPSPAGHRRGPLTQ
jgi:TPR repeat protein